MRVHAYNAELRVDTSRVVGYRQVCSCGGRAKVKGSVRAARAEPIDHLGERVH